MEIKCIYIGSVDMQSQETIRFVADFVEINILQLKLIIFIV